MRLRETRGQVKNNKANSKETSQFVSSGWKCSFLWTHLGATYISSNMRPLCQWLKVRQLDGALCFVSNDQESNGLQVQVLHRKKSCAGTAVLPLDVQSLPLSVPKLVRIESLTLFALRHFTSGYVIETYQSKSRRAREISEVDPSSPLEERADQFSTFFAQFPRRQALIEHWKLDFTDVLLSRKFRLTKLGLMLG